MLIHCINKNREKILLELWISSFAYVFDMFLLYAMRVARTLLYGDVLRLRCSFSVSLMIMLTR